MNNAGPPWSELQNLTGGDDVAPLRARVQNLPDQRAKASARAVVEAMEDSQE